MKWNHFETAPKDKSIFAAYWGSLPTVIYWSDALRCWVNQSTGGKIGTQYHAWAEISTPSQSDVFSGDVDLIDTEKESPLTKSEIRQQAYLYTVAREVLDDYGCSLSGHHVPSYLIKWLDENLPQRIDRKEMENNQCSQCREFFARFSCSKAVHLECDCPKCMGLCECITTQRGERR